MGYGIKRILQRGRKESDLDVEGRNKVHQWREEDEQQQITKQKMDHSNIPTWRLISSFFFFLLVPFQKSVDGSIDNDINRIALRSSFMI